MSTSFSDLDAVLGGGILPAGVMLLAGQPGIGKSTLLLQVEDAVARNQSVLYVSGEESAHQVKLRATRLGAHTSSELHFVSSTSADDIAATIRSGSYKLVIIDSIQTLSLEDITNPKPRGHYKCPRYGKPNYERLKRYHTSCKGFWSCGNTCRTRYKRRKHRGA